MNIRRIASTFAASCAVGLGAVIVAPDAAASVPTTYCDGQSYAAIVNTYARGAEALALRCGTATWGFNHITARWNDAFESNIALTIARGESASDLQQDGGDNIYALFDTTCNEIFRVIYNHGGYNGNDVMPQGIITAYETSPIQPAAGTAAVAETDYRTDCPIIQTI